MKNQILKIGVLTVALFASSLAFTQNENSNVDLETMNVITSQNSTPSLKVKSKLSTGDIDFVGQYIYTSNGLQYQLLRTKVATYENAFGVRGFNLNGALVLGEELTSKDKATGLTIYWQSPGQLVIDLGVAGMINENGNPFGSVYFGFGYKF